MESKLRRRVLVEIETSLAPGRDMLRGIAKFVREVHQWDVHHHAGHWSLHGGAEGRQPTDIVPNPDEVDGVITRVHDEVSERAALEAIGRGIPVVDVLGDGPSETVPLVHTDDAAIGSMAAHHLREKGFSRFAFCGIASIRWSVRRGEAFKTATGTCRLPMLELERTGDIGAGHAEIDRFAEWLESLEKPTGIFVSCDHIAPPLLEACTRLGITVPQQVAVVGVNNDTVACNICNPTLSSIDGSHFQIGYRGARLLESMMAGAPPPTEPIFVLPRRLIVRESSGEPVIEDPVIARAARFISRNAAGPIGVDDVANEVSLSRRELQRRFPKATGRTVHAALLEARIEISKRLLQSSEYSIDAIATMSGFGSRQHFAKSFREHTGTSPKNYRREQVV